jgi:hypothetical protein
MYNIETEDFPEYLTARQMQKINTKKDKQKIRKKAIDQSADYEERKKLNARLSAEFKRQEQLMQIRSAKKYFGNDFDLSALNRYQKNKLLHKTLSAEYAI